MFTSVKTARRDDPEYTGRSLSFRRSWFADESSDNSDSTNQGTTESNSTSIDWSKVDPTTIPLDVVKRNPEYEKLLAESIQRRQQLKSLRDQLETPKTDTPETPNKPDIVNPVPQELLTQITELRKFVDEYKKGEQERENLRIRQEAAVEVGLEPEDHIHLIGQTKEELIKNGREFLAKYGLNSGSTGVGGDKAVTSVAARVFERVKGNTTNNDLFSPKSQTGLGGGISKD